MEKLQPAIENCDGNSLKNIPFNEFQNILTGWLHEKGFVKNWKSYIKFQMIDVLKNTEVGKKLKKNTTRKEIYTLTHQALNLIIAEYLMHHGCNFTLSLFNSEMNLSHQFLLQNKFRNEDETSILKYDKENVVNILELIGLSTNNSGTFGKIITEYFEDSQNSLLSCILNNTVKQQTQYTDKDFLEEDDFLKRLQLILNSQNLSKKMESYLFKNIKLCYEVKITYYENQVIKLIEKFQNELKSATQKTNHIVKKNENKINKLVKENGFLQRKINAISVNNKEHCNHNECVNAKNKLQVYENEIRNLKKEKGEIEHFNMKYKSLLEEFEIYKKKEDIIAIELDLNEDNKSSSEISLAIDVVKTEDVLKNTKENLKLLEKENEELDLKINNKVVYLNNIL